MSDLLVVFTGLSRVSAGVLAARVDVGESYCTPLRPRASWQAVVNVSKSSVCLPYAWQPARMSVSRIVRTAFLARRGDFWTVVLTCFHPQHFSL